MTDFDATSQPEMPSEPPAEPNSQPEDSQPENSHSETTSSDTPPEAPTESAAEPEAQTGDPNDSNPWAEWQTNVERLRQQAETAWQQGLAQIQMQFDRDLQHARDRLLSASIAARNANDVEPLVAASEALLIEAKLNPEQIAIAIQDLPTARDRSLVMSALWHASAPESDLRNQEGLRAKVSQVYGESGCPLVRDRDGIAIDLDLSVALVTALVAGQAAEATMAGFTQLLGRGKRSIILGSDDALRRKGLKQSQSVLGERAIEDSATEKLKPLMNLDADTLPEDSVLELLTLGIQGAQVGEFVAKKTRSVLDAAPPLLSGVAVTLQLLMSDVVLDLSNTVGSSLENSSVRRRVQLLIAMLPEASRVPTPQQYFEMYPQAIATCSPLLAPIFSQQLVSVAAAIDPQQRNVNINRLGRQFNQINPAQFWDGWLNSEWLEQWRNGVESLCAQYPQLEALQTYRVGLERAASGDRLMDQAVELRKAAIALDPEKADDISDAATS